MSITSITRNSIFSLIIRINTHFDNEIFVSAQQEDDERHIRILYQWIILDIWFNMNDQYFGNNSIRTRLDENNSLFVDFNDISSCENTLCSILACVDSNDGLEEIMDIIEY